MWCKRINNNDDDDNNNLCLHPWVNNNSQYHQPHLDLIIFETIQNLDFLLFKQFNCWLTCLLIIAIWYIIYRIHIELFRMTKTQVPAEENNYDVPAAWCSHHHASLLLFMTQFLPASNTSFGIVAKIKKRYSSYFLYLFWMLFLTWWCRRLRTQRTFDNHKYLLQLLQFSLQTFWPASVSSSDFKGCSDFTVKVCLYFLQFLISVLTVFHQISNLTMSAFRYLVALFET